MTFSFVGIDHVQLAAPPGSEDIAREFFGRVLGLAEIPKPSNLAARGGVWFSCGQHQLHIGVQKDFNPARKAHPAFHVRNLDALRVRLTENKLDAVEDEPLEGAKRFYTADPFGNRLEFIEWLTPERRA